MKLLEHAYVFCVIFVVIYAKERAFVHYGIDLPVVVDILVTAAVGALCVYLGRRFLFRTVSEEKGDLE